MPPKHKRKTNLNMNAIILWKEDFDSDKISNILQHKLHVKQTKIDT